MAESNNNQAIIDVVERLSDVDNIVVKDAAGVERLILSVPNGRKLQSIKPFLDEYLPRPERRKGTSTHSTLASFIAICVRFKDVHSAVFLDEFDRSEPSLLAVFDYHGPTSDNGDPNFGQHRAEYDFPISEDWKAWTKAAERGLSQVDFAALLEDRILNVQAPDSAGPSAKQFAADLGIQLAAPARLLELSKGLSIKADIQVAQAVNLSTGETQFNFVETHGDRDGAPLKMPGGFVIAIPIFQGGALYPIPVRLRYRLHERKVTWYLTLANLDKIFDDATNEAVEEVKSKTGLPVYRGRPEA